MYMYVYMNGEGRTGNSLGGGVSAEEPPGRHPHARRHRRRSPTPHTLHPTPYILHPETSILNPTPSTLNPEP